METNNDGLFKKLDEVARMTGDLKHSLSAIQYNRIMQSKEKALAAVQLLEETIKDLRNAQIDVLCATRKNNQRPG